MIEELINFQNVGVVYGLFFLLFNWNQLLLPHVCLLLIQNSICSRRNFSQWWITKGIVFLIQDLLARIFSFISKLRFILQISFLILWAIKFITQFKSCISKAFESYFDMVSPSILNSDHVNKALVLFILAIYNFGKALFFCFIQYFALTVITWAWQITVRRLINENLTKLISKETLLRLKEPHNSAHWKSLAFDELVKVKLFL